MRAVPIVELRWVDSECSNQWTNVHDLHSELELNYACGYLIKKDEQMYVLCVGICPTNNDFNAILYIPSSCVMEEVELCKRMMNL